MYAVVRTGGKQYRVEQGQRLQVERRMAVIWVTQALRQFDGTAYHGRMRELNIGIEKQNVRTLGMSRARAGGRSTCVGRRELGRPAAADQADRRGDPAGTRR